MNDAQRTNQTTSTLSPIQRVARVVLDVVAGLIALIAMLMFGPYMNDARYLGQLFFGLALAVALVLIGHWPRQMGGAGRQSQPVPSPLPPRACPRCGRALSSETAHGLCPACLLQQATASESGAPNPSTFTPPSVAELAPLFPQLEILELLGRGGMGAVYKARQPGLDRFVALKILPATTGADPAFAERFQREARALAALNHPRIVAVYDFGQLPTLSYFVMEYVDGVNLRQLERTARLSPREALAIVPQVCEALQFAHDRGIVHRDIKPENILVDKQGRVKIADFGLAKLLRVEPGGFALTETRNVVGTPQYMAPEQVEKPQSVDHRADIYSLGVVFYEMLTGELPLGRFPVPSQRVQVDVRLDEVVLKALEKEPDRRYQQASAFKTKVETYASVPTGRGEPPARPLVVEPTLPAAGEPAARPYQSQVQPQSGPPPIVPSVPTFSWAGKSPLSHGARIFLNTGAGLLVLLAAMITGLMLNSNRADKTGPILSVISCLATTAVLVAYGRWPQRQIKTAEGSALPVEGRASSRPSGSGIGHDEAWPSNPNSNRATVRAALSPGQRAGQFGARVLYVMAALIALWPVIGLVMDFDDRGHGPRFAGCWTIAAVIAALGRVLQLLASPSARR